MHYKEKFSFMEEWKKYKVADVIEEISMGPFGSNIKVSNFIDTGVPVLNGSNLQGFKLNEDSFNYVSDEKADSLGRANAFRGDIVITHRGTLGQIVYIPDNSRHQRYVISQSQFRLKLNPKLARPDFFTYYFHTREGQHKILMNASQVGVPALARPTSTFKEVAISLPKIEEQTKIMAILHSLDDKIAVNKKICENLEAQAQALFKHWFVDFAPFKDGKFVESELGLIPEGWRVGTLGEYVDNLGGYSYTGSELQPSTTAMATIKNFVRGGGFKIEGYKEIVISKNIKDYQYINMFDVLVAHTDLTQNAEVVGNPAIILSTAGYEKLIMSMDLTKVVPKDKRLTAPLIHSILSTSKFKEHALGYVNGTTVLHMNKKAVPEYKLAMPNNLDVIKELSTLLDDLYSAMSETYAENLRLATLRDTLLPKLMSGQIKLNEYE